MRLRDDGRIRAIESGAKHNEPKRVDSAQMLKAAGSSYSEDGSCPNSMTHAMLTGTPNLHQTRTRSTSSSGVRGGA